MIARSFVALDVDDASARAGARAQRLLEGLPVRLTPSVEGVHLTIKFLGDVDIEAVGLPLFGALRPLVEGRPAPPLGAAKLDAFPSPDRAHVIVLSTPDPSGAILALGALAEDAATALGVARESRAFRPHLTLARSKRAIDVSTLVKKAAVFELGAATRLVLYRSDRGDRGSRYTALAHADFAL